MQAVSRWCLFGGVLVSALVASRASAVVILNNPTTTPTTSRNVLVSNSSAGVYSGGAIGDWVANDGDYSAVAIGPNAFLTAKHFTSASTITLGSQTYTVTNTAVDANSDLEVLTVNGTIASYAPIYTGSAEQGSAAVIFGRGRTAGTLVTSTVNGATVNNGFLFGTTGYDDQLSYGQDTIDTAVSSVLRWNFDPTKTHATSLTDGDSGGAVFILKGTTWYLAGINSGLSSPFSASADGSNPFNAMIFNASGLYYNDAAEGQPADWEKVTGPGFSQAARVSSQISFLSTFVPEPASLSILAIGGMLALRRRSR